MNSLESFVQTRESFGAGTVHFHLQRKSGWTLAMECELVLSTGLSSALPMWVKIAYRSEFVQGEPVRCPGTILMLDSDLVDYLCYLRAEVFGPSGKHAVVAGLTSWQCRVSGCWGRLRSTARVSALTDQTLLISADQLRLNLNK